MPKLAKLVADAAFDEMHAVIRQPLQLHKPISDRPYVLHTDNVGIATGLFKSGKNGAKRPAEGARAQVSRQRKQRLALVWAF